MNCRWAVQLSNWWCCWLLIADCCWTTEKSRKSIENYEDWRDWLLLSTRLLSQIKILILVIFNSSPIFFESPWQLAFIPCYSSISLRAKHRYVDVERYDFTRRCELRFVNMNMAIHNRERNDLSFGILDKTMKEVDGRQKSHMTRWDIPRITRYKLRHINKFIFLLNWIFI